MGRRKKDCVISDPFDVRYGLCSCADIGDQLELFFHFNAICIHHKHTPEKPRLRLIIPLSHEISPMNIWLSAGR